MTTEEIYAIKPDAFGWRRLPSGNYVILGDGVRLGNYVRLGNGVSLGDGGWRISVGCRFFTYDQALLHWAARDDRAISRRVLEFMRTEAIARGWEATAI